MLKIPTRLFDSEMGFLLVELSTLCLVLKHVTCIYKFLEHMCNSCKFQETLYLVSFF